MSTGSSYQHHGHFVPFMVVILSSEEWEPLELEASVAILSTDVSGGYVKCIINTNHSSHIGVVSIVRLANIVIVDIHQCIIYTYTSINVNHL